MSVLLKRNSSNLYHNWEAVTSSDVLFYSLFINRFQKKCFLKKCKPKITSEEIQNEIYELGKKYKYELKDWFLFLYETLLGQKNGPRLGTFILLLSIKETIKLIEDSFSR